MAIEKIRANPKAETKSKQDNQLKFEISNKTTTAQETTGNFPTEKWSTRTSLSHLPKLTSKKFALALLRISIIADNTHHRIEFTFQHNKFLLKSESPETGNSIEETKYNYQFLKQSENNTIEILSEPLLLKQKIDRLKADSLSDATTLY